MATINDQGNIQACCPHCSGALTNFEWSAKEKSYGSVTVAGSPETTCYRLYRCVGCGSGAMAVVRYTGSTWPGDTRQIVAFHSETRERMKLPRDLPQALTNEFREAEKCLDAGCRRAALGVLRSLIVKTLRANGYYLGRDVPLYRQVEAAADDGVITRVRRSKARRLLGTDVTDDEWHEPPYADVEALRRYAQQLLEDLYDDRPAVALLLREAGRIADESKKPPATVTGPARLFSPQHIQ